MPISRIIVFLLSLVIGTVGVSGASSAIRDSTPIGPLPKGPITEIATAQGSLVAVALPRQSPSTGLVWRVARQIDSRILKQLSEADVGMSVVLVFRATAKGDAAIRFGLTRGDSSGKALRSATYRIHIR